MSAKAEKSVRSTVKAVQTQESSGDGQQQEFLKRIRILELQNSMLTRQVQELQAELSRLSTTQVKYLADLYRCKEEIKILKLEVKQAKETADFREIRAFRQELDRLKLTAKLNSNAIERLTRQKEE